MTPLQQHIYDVLMYAGPNGISGDELFDRIYRTSWPWRIRSGKHDRQERTVLKAHIHNINKRLKGSSWHIDGSPVAGGWYWLKQDPKVRARMIKNFQRIFRTSK